jgi:hypothetical protein
VNETGGYVTRLRHVDTNNRMTWPLLNSEEQLNGEWTCRQNTPRFGIPTSVRQVTPCRRQDQQSPAAMKRISRC